MIPNQFGFRKGHSTSHALDFSINHIQEALREKQHVLGIFIDLSTLVKPLTRLTIKYSYTNFTIMGSEVTHTPFLRAIYQTVPSMYTVLKPIPTAEI